MTDPASPAEAAVLLHPLGNDGSFWAPVLETWGASGGVLTPDLLGHGGADLPPLGSGIEVYTDAVLAACEERDLGRIDVVGVSLGGLVAQDLAIRYPEVVRRLVLVDTVAVYPEFLRANWRERAATARADGLAPLADAMEAMWFTDAFRADQRQAVADVRGLFLRQDPEGYARTCEALELTDTRPGLPGIEAPTLVVCGEHDAPPFVEAAHLLSEQIPDARLRWLTGAKHAAVLEQPDVFAGLLAEFLS